jgi:hypothetical protein
MTDKPQAMPDRAAEERLLESAVQRAVRQSVLASAYAGQAVPIWRDGKVVWLQPGDIFAELGAPPPAKPDDKAGAA